MKHATRFLCGLAAASMVFWAAAGSAEHFFQTHNTWYERIPDDPVLIDHSSDYVADILINGTTMYVNRGMEWSVPLYRADADTALSEVQLDNPDSNCGSNALANGWNLVPIPDGAVPAGNEAACAGEYRDGHMVVVSHDGLSLWEFYHAEKCGTEPWRAGCVRRWDTTGSGVLDEYDLRGSCRACAGGATLTHGLLLYDEVSTDTIDHALAFCYNGETIENHWALFPCRSYRGGISDRAWAMLMGERIQLDPAVDCSALGLTIFGERICRALQDYGMIFVENTSPGNNYVFAEATADWGDEIGSLDAIPLDRLRIVEPIHVEPGEPVPDLPDETVTEEGAQEPVPEIPDADGADAAADGVPDRADAAADTADEAQAESEGCGCALVR